MAKASPFEPLSRRLSVYGYLAPLVDGARVLEIGTGEGGGAAHLLRMGARSVVGADGDAGLLSRARTRHREAGLSFQPLERRALESGGGFDLIVVPDAGALVRATSGLTVTAVRSLLSGAQGHLVLVVPSADRPGADAAGASGFYEVTEALERLFPRVRMFGVTPFAAYGVAEFSEATSGLRIDGGLVEEAAEQPTHYLALAGPDDNVELGYALVQIPADTGGDARSAAAAPAADGVDAGQLADLRRRLAEAEGKAEGVVRVSRAQTEEIEELRARLRRASESRAEQDREVDRLRKALAEADESVLDLTRRTREEMNALAARITAGLRPSDGAGASDDGPMARLREEVRRREEALAARESALSERDERIAGLEADRQDLQWQVDAGADAGVATAPPAAARAPAPTPAPASGTSAPYRLAAAAHLQEVNRLREALAEQSTLVAELEDSLAARDAKLATIESELAALRKHAGEIEQADRARRSRLAEVEGTLLRLQRQAALAASQPVDPGSSNGAAAPPRDFDRANQALAGQVTALEARLREADQTRTQIEQRYGDAVERLAAMERALAEQNDRAAAATAAETADAPRLETALREVSRLREALERSEEQLWETKGQLLLDRERMAVMEHELSSVVPAGTGEPTITEAAHQSIMKSVLTELVELESSIRQELDRLDSVERMIDGWRADLAVDADVPFTGPNQ